MNGKNRLLEVTAEPVEFENNRMKLNIGRKTPIRFEDYGEHTSR
jgi:hypothetical protein